MHLLEFLQELSSSFWPGEPILFMALDHTERERESAFRISKLCPKHQRQTFLILAFMSDLGKCLLSFATKTMRENARRGLMSAYSLNSSDRFHWMNVGRDFAVKIQQKVNQYC